MPKKRPVVWVAIADGEHARVVAPTAVRHQFATRIAIDSVTAHKRAAELGGDRPGRVFESATTARHAVVPKNDPHELAKRKFVSEVARTLNEHAQQNAFDRLVLVAPSRTLHDLREELGPQAAAKVVGMVAKDLTGVKDNELPPHLAEWWVPPPGEFP
ncbi:host attachment protein [Limobrevibacterium gyesilva]|uniref:Host attachment protein n=1 Tax=Limobrevibacterium gyesilva TaxID=2991712 RepID=A0AA41YJA8_9PROT|nr:host attachment protein [Limobrevibacterium gyesilva]MCW3474219.1 host attachment protein [Limobrevibacterium gyesilva]